MLPKFALISGLRKFKKSCKIMVVGEHQQKLHTVLMCMRELCNCSHYWIHSFVFVKEETCLSVWRQLFYIVAKLRSFPLFYFLFLVTIKAFETFLNLSLYFLLIAVLLKKDYSLFTFPKICFHFQNGFLNELSFSKCGSFSKCAFIFKMWKI